MNFLYKIYFFLPNFAFFGLPGKAVNRMLGFFLKRLFDWTVPAYLNRTSETAGYGLNTEKRDKLYIVSLTSFPGRINDVWIPIEIILRQTFKPDKVILWLASSQFPDHKLPKRLLRLMKRGLTIQFCDEDIRSHKKYYYAMKQYPNAFIITLDDDLYYDYDVIKNVVDLHLLYPQCIATNRAHKFTFDKDGKVSKYRKWQHNVTDKQPTHLLVPTGGAGTLYPPGLLHSSVLDREVFKTICFHADDLWLKCMAYLNNTLIVTNSRYNKDFITISATQRQKLVTTNVMNGGNDEQLKNVIEHYGINLELLN